jgi:glycosyltransferase involved in cell wall biosynthesis
MFSFRNPLWIDASLVSLENLSQVSDSVFDSINQNLSKLVSATPEVSIVIPVWNEEVNIIRTIHSLSKSSTRIPLEIIVVNNNSTDNTQHVLNRLHISSFLQPIQGCGPARQLGQENAKGKYILMADADCYYPAGWVDALTKALQQKDMVCVYGRYSFLGNQKNARWKFFFYERMRDVIVELRHFKRPYLNSLGMNMGYVKEYGLKVGFVNYKIRGEDGRLCFDLMKYGKIGLLRGSQNRVWTTSRTIDKENSLGKALVVRVFVELGRLGQYFYKKKPHDTKTSKSSESFLLKFFKKYKDVHKD